MKLSISPDQQSEILYSSLLLYFHVKDYQNIMKLSHWSLLPYIKHFQKTNKGQEVVSLPIFFMIFEDKYF